MITDATPHYAAFISYAHADEAVAARLHKALETFPVPKHLRREGQATRPIFRDLAELTAAHSLSEKIRDAVNNSRVLIVLCSPAAKASHWVNEEIKLFREIHGEGAILSALIEGTPATSFPEALIQDGREPLAASLGGTKAGFRLGVTQLAAGILGTGLDDLVQRGARRRTRLMGAGMAASLLLSGIMGFTAFQAVNGLNEAELERNESEALLKYMIKDLKVKLEPVGRLELLEGVGRKAVDYYDKKEVDELSDDNLTLLAAARQVLAQVALDAGRMEEAQIEIEASAALTREVMARNPNDTNAIYAHAQSEYWVGAYFHEQGKLAEMEKPWQEYDRLAQELYLKDPTSFDWVMEAAWGKNNLGLLNRAYEREDTAKLALGYYNQALSLFEKALVIKPDSKLTKTEIANAMSGKASILKGYETANVTQEYYQEFSKFSKDLSEQYPEDVTLSYDYIRDELDYLNGYVLEHGDKSKRRLSRALDSLFEIVFHDIENMRYQSFFLNSVYNSLEYIDSAELKKRHDEVDSIIALMRETKAQDLRYFIAMKRVMKIKILVNNSNKNEAYQNLKLINAEQLKNVDFEIDHWRLSYSLFLINSEFFNDEIAREFGSRFLKSISDQTEQSYPTILEKKIAVYVYLQECDKANVLIKNLSTRGYSSASGSCL